MNEPERGSSGWSVGKVLGLIVGLLGMVGFGLCSLLGIVVVGTSTYGDVSVIVMTVFGVTLTVLSGWLFRTMIRKARENRERDR